MDTSSLIVIKLSAESDRPVPFDTFAHVMPEWNKIINAFATDYAEVQDPEWDVVFMAIGSTELGVRPRINHEETMVGTLSSFGSNYEVMSRALIDSLSDIERGVDPSDVMPNSAITPFNKLSKAFSDSVVSIAVTTPYSATEITSAVTTARPDANQRFASIGTVSGTIQGVFFGGRRPYFQVRHRRRSVLIKCYFDADRHYDDVMTNMRKQVELRGRLIRDFDGAIIRVQDVRLVMPVQDDSQLPTLSELAGIVPDLTDGRPSDEWIRRQRSGQ